MFCWWLYQQMWRSEAPVGLFSWSLVPLNVHTCNTPPRKEGGTPSHVRWQVLTFEYSLWCFVSACEGWRWRWYRFWGGAVLVAEGHGWEEGSCRELSFRAVGACGSVPISFSCFICKHNERGVTSVLERLPIAIAPSPPTVMLGKPVEKKEQFISVPTIW